ncbi:MAG: hypothetical protein FWE97_00260 [Dehalococcoidia bacterium]|nr:hypothetical protein [Dehalococcoidia bacterium]
MGPLVLIAIIGLLALTIWIWIIVASWFAEVAKCKGYDFEAWKIRSLLCGMPVWILIAALPNKTYHEELLAALRETDKFEKDIPKANSN